MALPSNALLESGKLSMNIFVVKFYPTGLMKNSELYWILYFNGYCEGTNGLTGPSIKNYTFEKPNPINTRITGMRTSTTRPL